MSQHELGPLQPELDAWIRTPLFTDATQAADNVLATTAPVSVIAPSSRAPDYAPERAD